MKKISQAWGLDLMIAVMVFFSGIVVFYIYSINYSANQDDLISKMINAGNLISDSILSEGYPKNWSADNVAKIGILSSGKINETKLERFYYLASGDYNKTKRIFNLKYDYYFFSDENFTINSLQVEGIGKKPGDTENLVKVMRLAAYQEKPINIYVYIYEEK